MIGIEVSINPKSQDGKNFKRDKHYCARATLRKINTWKDIVQKEHVPSPIEREIINYNLSEDQQLMLQIIDKNTEKEIVNIMERLVPFYKRNSKILEQLHEQLYDDNNPLIIAEKKGKYTSHRINEIYKQQDEYYYLLERSIGYSHVNRAVKQKFKEGILWDALMDSIYDNGDKYFGDECQVKMNENSIIITHKVTNEDETITYGYLNYTGKKNKRGHFVVKAREEDISSTLRMNKDKNMLEGNFIEESEKGFWKIRLIRRKN